MRRGRAQRAGGGGVVREGSALIRQHWVAFDGEAWGWDRKSHTGHITDAKRKRCRMSPFMKPANVHVHCNGPTRRKAWAEELVARRIRGRQEAARAMEGAQEGGSDEGKGAEEPGAKRAKTDA